MNRRIIPLNLPAKVKLSERIAGNPATSRLESIVANSHPGLEVDHRNLDRRFFPGLIFEFVYKDPGTLRGAKLIAVDENDLDRPKDAEFKGTIQELSRRLPGADIFLHSLEQGSKRIVLANTSGSQMLDGRVVWRLIRSLEPGPLKIELVQYDGSTSIMKCALEAQRRVFQDRFGALSSVYKPGELTQSLCSPWQHDFRDCTCNYWASNHPDVALPAHPANIEEFRSGQPGVELGEDPVLWLRWDRARDVAPLASPSACRPLEMDHYEINARWSDLPVVLEGRETLTPYSIGVVETATPLPQQDLNKELARLAGMEHALALEYLYARYSVRFGDAELSEPEREHADFIAHELLAIAISEMMHLRWANQLMWELSHLKSQQDYVPALRVSDLVPGKMDGAVQPDNPPTPKGMRKPQMRPLNVAIEDFLAAEKPSGTLDGQYSRIFATVRRGYPTGICEIVSRTIADGVSHFSRFLQIRAILRLYASPIAASSLPVIADVKLVRPLKPGDPKDPKFKRIADAYATLLKSLYSSYRNGDAEDRFGLSEARAQMQIIDADATSLAREGDGIGVPFLDLAAAVKPLP